MRRNFLFLSCAALTCVVTYVGLRQSQTRQTDVSWLTLEDVETLSNTEDPELNSPWLWFSQGLTKDEREEKVSCKTNQVITESEVTVNYEGMTETVKGKKTEPAGEYKITCPYGNQNCTETKC